MAHDVFISYSTKNTTEAEQVCTALEQAGITCWMAPRDIQPGENWAGAIKGCGVFLLLVSEASNISEQVLNEVVLATGKKKQVIPFFIESVTLSNDLEYYLARIHWLLGYPPPLEKHFFQLIANVRSLLPSSLTPVQKLTAPKIEPVPLLKPIPPPVSTAAPAPKPAPPRIESVAPPALRELIAGSTRIREKDGMVMVYVPAGEFLMGSSDDDPDASDAEKPQHKVYLDAYWMDRTPVTNAMFKSFLSGMGNQKERDSHWYDPEWGMIKLVNKTWQITQGYEPHPVVGVTWYGASAYAKWAGASLPSEAQWEKAARSTDGRIYPWGNQPPDQTLANFAGNIGDTTPVGNYPKGASPYGALDMAGNVWEWTRSLWGSDSKGPDFGYPYDPQDTRREDITADRSVLRVLRGGSWLNVQRHTRCAFRARLYPGLRLWRDGFRLSLSKTPGS